MNLLRFVLVVLAAYRVTRAVTYDEFPPSQWLRRTVVMRFGTESSWFKLITCPWCIGFWISTAAVFVLYRHAALEPNVVRAFAVSTLVGTIAGFVER